MAFKHNFTAELVLPVSPERIYDILIDPVKMGSYVPTVISVKIVSDKKKGAGVVSRWQSRRPDGTVAEWNETIAVEEKNRRMVFRYMGSSDTQGEYLLSPIGDGKTKVVFTESMQELIADEKWHQEHVKEILENLKNAVMDH
ncbi:MAG: SRPBCC family protein [Candidatus Ranarchaeia archaeon]